MRRRIIQIISLVFFVFFMGRFVFEHAAGVAIAMSPTLHIGNLLRFHRIELAWLIPAIVIFLLAWWRGRFFCVHICPLGFFQDLLPSFNLWKTRIHGLNIVILASLFGLSLVSLNLMGMIDPLTIFARSINVARHAVFEKWFWFLLPIVIVLILSLFRKRFWCLNICPLGTFVDCVEELRLRTTKDKQGRFDISKRKALIALGGGLAAGLLMQWQRSAYANPRLIRPPAALPEALFKETCVRCGNCVRACITNGLQPAFLESGWDGMLTPRLIPRLGECDEYCNRCGLSCPTGAIQPLPLSVKRNVRMGQARINRSTCIAWAKQKLCMVCQEYCPYLAIGGIKNKGVLCPVVKEEVCRGCGACERACPVEGAAIRVYRVNSKQI